MDAGTRTQSTTYDPSPATEGGNALIEAAIAMCFLALIATIGVSRLGDSLNTAFFDLREHVAGTTGPALEDTSSEPASGNGGGKSTPSSGGQDRFSSIDANPGGHQNTD